MQAPRAAAAATLLIVVLGVTGCPRSYSGGARAVSPREVGAGWYRAAATPVVRQHHRTDCGLAALAMVAGAWGRRWSVAELNRVLPPSERGVKLGALRDLARARGFEAYAIKATVRDLEHELAAGRPVMLGLRLPLDRDHNVSHYEVAIAFRQHDGTVVTIDPASGAWRQRSPAVLELEWRSAGFAALVVVGERRAAAR